MSNYVLLVVPSPVPQTDALDSFSVARRTGDATWRALHNTRLTSTVPLEGLTLGLTAVGEGGTAPQPPGLNPRNLA